MMNPEIIIDRAYAARNLPVKISASNLPTLKKGESFMAQVVSSQGGHVTFKTPEGKTFAAQMLAEFALQEGATAELLVRQNSSGKIIMQLLSVEAALSGAKKDALNSLGLQNNVQAREAAALFKQINIRPAEPQIQAVMNILKEHPALNVSAAVFFVANQLPPTAENVQTLLKLVSQGSDMGESLMALASQAMEEMAMGQPAGSAPFEAAASPAGLENTQPAKGNSTANISAQETQIYINVNEKTDAAPAANTARGEAPAAKPFTDAPPREAQMITQPAAKPQPQSGTQTQQTAHSAPMPGLVADEALQTPPQPPLQTKEQAIPQDNKEQPALPMQPPEAEASKAAITLPGQQDAATGASAGAPKQSAAEALIAKLAALLLSAEAVNAEELEKSAKNTREELPSLQQLIEQSSLKHKDALSAKFADIAAQEKLTADINRFACLHIPVTIGRQAQTAELYIYKNNRRGKRIDKENTVIFIGIDTPYLGRTEARLQIDKKNVSMVLKLENEAALKLAREQNAALYKALAGLGYRLTDTKIMKLEEKTTVVDAEEVLIKTDPPVFIDYKI
jgi:hypothetical protein